MRMASMTFSGSNGFSMASCIHRFFSPLFSSGFVVVIVCNVALLPVIMVSASSADAI